MAGPLTGLIVDHASDHFGDRDLEWWTGPNSVWGRLTSGDQRPEAQAPGPVNIAVILGLLYFFVWK